MTEHDERTALPPAMFSPGLLNWVRDWSSPVDIRCGGQDTPPNPPFSASLYPFTTLTKLDYQSYPNWRDKRLEPNLSLGPEGWYIGYEDGEFVAATRFLPGRKMRFELELQVMNATHADTFIELVVEPNARISVFHGTDRMRCITGPLGVVWPGLRAANAWFEVEALGATDFVTRGELHIARSGAFRPLSWSFESAVHGTVYNASTDDALWQLRWRIDRMPNLDLYDDTYQVNNGVNNHATEREIRVSRASLRGI